MFDFLVQVTGVYLKGEVLRSTVSMEIHILDYYGTWIH